MEDLVNTFDLVTFESDWEDLTEEEKSQLIENTDKLDTELAILPILAGINSYHFSVRNIARKSLENIQIKIAKLLVDPLNAAQYQAGLKTSESVCARLYIQIHSDLSLQETNYLFKALIEFRGKGPYFAFKTFYKGALSVVSMEKIIHTVSESGQLAFVDQYLQSSPNSRLKYGRSFKKILQAISERENVVRFFAFLFDQQRDADPFLNNIDMELRDPEYIISNEINSSSPEIRIIGLKALSMLTNQISSELLTDILISEEVKKVRIAIYSIIENSTLGTYPKLFDPILEMLAKSKKQEAIAAFRALVVTGKKPLYTLFELIEQKYPSLMPDINIEISSLSKISFFVIQDIALNKEKYLHSNIDINLACVLGMIKKRPERVVKILKQYDNDSQDHLRMNVTRFIEKTRSLLAKEKKDIESEFEPIVEQANRASKKTKSLLTSFFSSPVEKCILKLRENKTSGSIDFKAEPIKDLDLSGSDFIAAPIYFNRSIIKNCDFSYSSFIAPFFKKTIFYNVNMENINLDGANFDYAVFINVNAKNAVFKECSFQHATMFNCNFNESKIVDCCFLSSIISKTSFNRTHIFCSSFSFSKISAVSFATSHIDQADFSNVKARFCRLPSKSRSIIRTDGIEYNARKFQLSFTDIPVMDAAVVRDIDILTFSEFIHYGEGKFFKQNKLSLLTALDIFKKKQADLFQIIPLLLHTNLEFPESKKIDPVTPVGIKDFTPDNESIQIIQKYIKTNNEVFFSNSEPKIEGLFTIGSVGSVAQTSDSDIDYWVCINEDKYTFEDNYLLDQKLERLEKMASNHFDTQVTFFKVDIAKARNNDFGDSSIESSGSAQTRILKEEFYRTMIHVAGKIPLWAVLPTSISLHYYNTILKHTGNMPNLSRYIDLGDIHAISNSEYYGASIWQMFKWLKSPFKSVIKMALLEKYIYEYGKQALLCNKYKDEWMNAGTQLQLAQNDSYYILINDLLMYYRKANDLDSVSLLLTCFFLKIEITNDNQIENTIFGLQKILLDKCIATWGWKKEKIFEIGSYKGWPYSKITKLSVTIEKYMVKKYKTVNKAFESLLHGPSQISPEDRTVLGRKVFIEFSNPPGKVQKILLVSRSDRHFQGLNLKYFNPTQTVGYWELFNKDNRSPDHHEEHLKKAKTIEEIGAWLINNHLYNSSAVINLVPNPTYVTFDDIRKLYSAMNDFFAPKLNQVVSFDQLLEKSRVVYLFISINFYAPRQQNKVTEYSAIYLNSWGEMFCKSVYNKDGFSSIEKTKQDIIQRIGVKKLPKTTAFYFSKGIAR